MSRITQNLLIYSECEEILRNAIEKKEHEEIKLLDFHLEPIEGVVGFLGEYSHLILDYAAYDKCNNQTNIETKRTTDKGNNDNVNHLRFFVKSLLRTSDEKENLQIFRKESKLYALVLKEFEKYLNYACYSKCYFSRNDLFVLQNLNNAGYQQSNAKDAVDCMEDNKLLAILKALAGLHAASLLFEYENKIKINEYFPGKLFEEITLKPDIAWFSVGIKTLVAVAENMEKYRESSLQSFFKNDFEEHLIGICDMQETSMKYRNVVCHRDIWPANVFFAIDNNNNNKDNNNNNNNNNNNIEFNDSQVSSAILVDFQTCRYCPPAIDLIFTLYMNLESEKRRAKELIYLKKYYEFLKLNLSKFNVKVEAALPFEELLNSYNELKFFGVVYKAISATIIKVPKEFVTNDYKYISRITKVLDYMRNNKEFRAFMENCIDEILEYLNK